MILLSYLFISASFALRHEVPSEIAPMIFASYRSLTGMAMYSPKDAPASGPPGTGKTSISADLSFKRDNTKLKAQVQLLVIPDKDMDGVGAWVDSTNYFCCTSDILKRAEGCREESQLNKLIITDRLKRKGFTDDNYHMVDFEADQAQVDVKWTHDVTKTGLNIFVVAVCDPYLGSVTFTGETEWLNPYGHLPGELYGFLPFYGWMCLVYVAGAVVWFALNFMYWKELLSIHNYITLVLAMCMLEMATWYGDYMSLNNAGNRFRFPFILGMMTSVTRRTVARMLVVAVSMGHGIVTPYLQPGTKKRIMILGFVYWVFAFLFEVFIHYHETNEVSPQLRLILTPPVAILDGIFWWWIFVSLHKTVIELATQKQSSKLSLYRNLAFTLGFALVIAFLFACYQLYYIWGALYLEQWQYMWVMEVGFWQILYTGVFFIIMALWRPNAHSKEYAYMQQIGTTEDALDDVEAFDGPDTMDD